MSFFMWIEGKIRRFHWYDISLIKLSTAAFTLMVAKFWPPLLSLEWQWYALIAILVAIPPLSKLCGCKKCEFNPCQCGGNDAIDKK